MFTTAQPSRNHPPTTPPAVPSVKLHPGWGRRAYTIFAEISRWSRNGMVSFDEEMIRRIPLGILRRLEARGVAILPGAAFKPIEPANLIHLVNSAIASGDLR